ncbi:hypothetical protein M9Y10_016941 [Tritrichomonas musculus]|uniref:Uncharacterized protein n=1 Tax=Tritrichomonas musculus TaxID=1915356 RepID=A0ABR2HXK0_9EUKA
MISIAHLISKYYNNFIPTATFHIPIQLEELNIKEIIESLPPEAKIISIESGSTFLTIAFIITNKLERTMEKYSQLITQINDKLVAWGDPIMGKNIKIKRTNIKFQNEKDMKNIVVNFIQNTEIVDQINFDENR